VDRSKNFLEFPFFAAERLRIWSFFRQQKRLPKKGKSWEFYLMRILR